MTHKTQTSCLTDLLENRIFIQTKVCTKVQLLADLVKAVCKDAHLSEAEMTARLLQREKELSTTLETGLSIPHLRVDELDRVVAALAILPKGLARKGKMTKAVFLFFSPARPAFFQMHLKVLSTLAETFTPAFMDRLLTCTQTEEVQQLLIEKFQK